MKQIQIWKVLSTSKHKKKNLNLLMSLKMLMKTSLNLEPNQLKVHLSSWPGRTCSSPQTQSKRSAARARRHLPSLELLLMVFLVLCCQGSLFLSLVLQVLVKLLCWITYQAETSLEIWKELVMSKSTVQTEMQYLTFQLTLHMSSRMISCSRLWQCVSVSSSLLTWSFLVLLNLRWTELKP